VNSILMAEETAARTSTLAPRAATPWATPVCSPFGTDLRDRSVLSSVHPSRRSYVAGGSVTGFAVLGTTANGLTTNGTTTSAAAKQDRPPRGEPR
jgi:hypothetical protein